MPHDLEQRMGQQVFDVPLTASEVVVHAQDVFPRFDQAFAEVRSDEASTAGDQNFFCHVTLELVEQMSKQGGFAGA